MANYRTEIFTLGHILWRIAEHRTNTASCFCATNACVSRPRYRCTGDHADPIELPPCNAEVPPYYNTIIKHCRARHPKDRRTARQLREMLPLAKKGETFSPEVIDGLKKFARCPAMTIYCDECGSSDMGAHYHCNHCYKSNFDLCTACHADGISCWDPEHRLLKRVITDETNLKVRVVPGSKDSSNTLLSLRFLKNLGVPTLSLSKQRLEKGTKVLLLCHFQPWHYLY